jgi:hypothetical protein
MKAYPVHFEAELDPTEGTASGGPQTLVSWKEVEEKIKRLRRPKNYSCRPVLIHINGVTQEVADSDYFAAIIDMGQQLMAS